MEIAIAASSSTSVKPASERSLEGMSGRELIVNPGW